MSRESEEQLRTELQLAKQKLLEQNEFIQKISTPPFGVAIVTHMLDEGVLIASGSGFSLLEKPARSVKVDVGDYVVLHPESSQIMKKIKLETSGSEATVSRALPNGLFECSVQHDTRVVFCSPKVTGLEVGSKVILDPTNSVILEKLPELPSNYSKRETAICWDDVGGHKEAKALLIEALEYPYTHAKIYAHYNKKAPKGVLLWGPPGCGKTMLGKACASSIAKTHGKDNSIDGFMYVKTPELLSPYVGETEAEIRAVFERARKHHAKHGYPAVIFFDEADSLMNRRGSGISSDVDRTIVPTFLTEMDGLETSTAIVVIATNRADTLDEAITREGRVDHKIEIRRPVQIECEEIYKLNLSNLPIDGRENAKSLAKSAAEYMFENDTMTPVIKNVSGAMVANVVARSTTYALRRDMESGRRSGIRFEDIQTSLNGICEEMNNLALNAQMQKGGGRQGATW